MVQETSGAAEEVRGVIKKVDSVNGNLILEGRGAGNRGLRFEFALTRETQVLFGKQTAPVSTLREGMRAHVAFENQNGRRSALSITVRGAFPQPEPVKVEENTVAGVIQRISFTERELVVVRPGSAVEANSETLLLIPEAASLTRNKKAIKFDELREGERVIARTAKRDGKTVESMEVGVAEKTAEGDPRIDKVRRIIKIANLVLEQMAKPKDSSHP
jgi:hypothetical protein